MEAAAPWRGTFYKTVTLQVWEHFAHEAKQHQIKGIACPYSPQIIY